MSENEQKKKPDFSVKHKCHECRKRSSHFHNGNYLCGWHFTKAVIAEHEAKTVKNAEKIKDKSCNVCDRLESCSGNDSGIFPCPDFISKADGEGVIENQETETKLMELLVNSKLDPKHFTKCGCPFCTRLLRRLDNFGY